MLSACEQGDLDTLTFLLQRNIDPSENSNRSIQLACENGHLEIVKLLLSHPKVDPSAVNNRAI